MLNINVIKSPKIVEELSFEKIKEELLENIQSVLPEYKPMESDRYMAVIEAFAYREIILRARINEAIKSMLLPTSTGADLDNVIAIYGLERRKGLKPRADIKLSLSTILDSDVTVHAGTMFTDSTKTYKARLVKDAVIKAGEKDALGTLELEMYTSSSSIKTEICLTPYRFVLKGHQPSDFTGGHEEESDEIFRKRAIESLERFSTAGSVESYKYHAFSANVNVRGVYVTSPNPGAVLVVIQVFGKKSDEERAKSDVEKVLTSDTVRPLTDKVTVNIAKKVDVDVEAVLELLDIFDEAAIVDYITNSFNSKTWDMGEDLNISYIYSQLHVAGVYRVKLISPSKDIKISEEEYVSINLKLKCVKAEL